MPKIENPDWLKKRLERLFQLAQKVSRDGPTTNYHDFTALKLIAVHYYAQIFSKIVRSQKEKGWTDGAVYVDLFAGTGLVRLKDSGPGDFMPGSPVCAASADPPFDYVVCVESKKENCVVLEERLSEILPEGRFAVIRGDCNQKISEVISLIRERFSKPILLTFVDPEGLEIKFSTLRELGGAFSKCDFVVNVNSSGVKRVGAKLERGVSNVRDSLEGYYDTDANAVLRGLSEGREPEEQYADLIEQVLGKSIGSTIKIRDEGERIAYYLLGYTRETQGGSRYASSFEDLARRLGWADRKQVRRMIERLSRRQSGMESFFDP